MKKKLMLKWVQVYLPLYIKILRIMRLTLFLFFISLIQVFSVNTYSQSSKISINLKNSSIKDVLYDIETKSEYYFLFNSQLVDVEKKVNIEVNDEKIEQVLDKLFAGQDVGYTIMNRQIIIQPSTMNSEKIIQQKKNISGKVKNTSGEPIPGATVVVKGTSNGTITDTDGNFTLPNIPGDATLVFSFVGMKAQEISVANKSVIEVIMEEEAVGIDEVVAIGYGTTKKRDLIGSVATVKSSELTQNPTSSFTDVLQGRAAGVQVATTSGSPGATVNINVRGVHSINSGSSPLWVIDGMPVFGNSSVGLDDGNSAGQNMLATMNPNDIESVEVLKDAAATAIYGSRGSNGVILITTKTGKANGKGSVQVDYSTGISHLAKPVEDFNFVNTKEWLEIADMSLY